MKLKNNVSAIKKDSINSNCLAKLLRPEKLILINKFYSQ